jgi:citrate synthase
VLLYRGYPIEELVEASDFYDVAYLLLYGELPTSVAKSVFRSNICGHTMVHEKIVSMIQSFHHDGDPMDVLCGCVGALAAFYPEACRVRDPDMQILACMRLIAKMPVCMETCPHSLAR